MNGSALNKKIRQLHEYRIKHLDSRSVSSIVTTLGQLSERWLNKNYFFRKKAVTRLVGRSLFSEAMANAILDSLFRELTSAKLSQLLKAELKDPKILDEFRKDKLTRTSRRARGPRLITHIFSGNIPNPSVVSFVLGMLVKSANIGKVSSKDEGILDIYLESLYTIDKKFAGSNFLIDPGDRRSLTLAIKESSLVVAYGDDDSLKNIKSQVPVSVPFVGYGHRISFAIYGKNALNQANLNSFARKTAHDIWISDQRGCLSPMEVLVERGGKISPDRFSFAFAKTMEKMYETKVWLLPAGRDKKHTITFGTGKKIIVRVIADLKEALKVLEPFQRYLQAVSLEIGSDQKQRARLSEKLSRLGVNRICRAGEMQVPPITWHHDGKWNLASWVNWTDLET